MTSEIRLRLNADCKSTFQNAADRHGVPLVHFITMAVHGYLRGIGDLSALEPAPATVDVNPEPTGARPMPAVVKWLTNPEGERYVEDKHGEEWTERELKRAYAIGVDPLGYYD